MGQKRAIGKRIWAIAEGYVPPTSTGSGREFLSHETICILNTTDEPAQISLMIYFSDRDPAGPYHIRVDPHRTLHQRTNDLREPEPVPLGRDYAMVVESSCPIVVQHTRLDSRQAANALMTTIAYSEA